MILPAIVIVASTISVPVRLEPAQPEVACTGVVYAASEAWPSASTPIDRRGDLSGVLDLEAGQWNLSLESKDCWAAVAPLDVKETGSPTPVRLEVWQRTEITGNVRVRSGDTLPSVVRVEVRPAGKTLSRTESCPVKNGSFSCSGPKASVDIKIHAEGFAPIYFWSVGGERGSIRLPPSVFERGGSISGWVLKPDRTPAADAEVQVTADTFALRREAQFGTPAAATRSNSRGFFQIRGLPPGAYTVRARSPNKDASTLYRVDAPDAREYVMEDVRLEPAASVDVQIQPARLPDGSRWLVALDRVTIDGLVSERPTPSSEAGRWILEQVERGAYRLRLVDTRGAVLDRRDVHVDRDVVSLLVEVGEVRVEGRVRAGGEPVESELKFDSAKGSVQMHSDDEGKFEGWLPSEGKWRVQITPRGTLTRVRTTTEIRVPPTETKATVDLDLPEGRIDGVVTNRKGEPVPEASVLVHRGSNVIANAGTDAAGSFSIIGIERGNVSLHGKKGRDESLIVQYNVSSGTSDKAVLVLEPRERIVGTLRRTNGRAIVGALIRYLVNRNLQSTVSGPSGDFEIELPPGATFADIVVVARGLPTRITRLDLAATSHDIVVSERAGIVRFKLTGAWPIVRYGQANISLPYLLTPAEGFIQPELDNDAVRIALEPGTYVVCYAADCSTHAVAAGAEVSVGHRDEKTKGGTL
jgi:hypothetical protein